MHTLFDGLVVRPKTHHMRSVDPLYQRVEEEDELQLLEQGLLLAHDLASLSKY